MHTAIATRLSTGVRGLLSTCALHKPSPAVTPTPFIKTASSAYYARSCCSTPTKFSIASEYLRLLRTTGGVCMSSMLDHHTPHLTLPSQGSGRGEHSPSTGVLGPHVHLCPGTIELEASMEPRTGIVTTPVIQLALHVRESPAATPPFA